MFVALALALLLLTAGPSSGADQAVPPLFVNTGKVEIVGPVYARTHLACDGVTDDRPAFKGLVEAGGACAGKTCLFDTGCTILWSSCATDASDCTVATVAPGTRLVFEGGFVKLAGRVCVGGSTPGAACPGGSADCNGGTCEYETGSQTFAHTGSATYTLLKGPTDAACTGFGTPWICCFGAGQGECARRPQGIEVLGMRVAVRQFEDYGRCTNGDAEDGLACKGYCVGGPLPGLGCDEAADCAGGTCQGAALCPGTVDFQTECDGAPESIIGDGAVVGFDFANTAGVTIADSALVDHAKGKGVLLGAAAVADGNNLVATANSAPLAPTTGYPAAIAFEVTNGIEAGRYSRIEGNRVRATSIGIDVSNTGGSQLDSQAPTVIRSNMVSASGEGAVCIRSDAAPTFVEDNDCSVAGDYVWGIRLTVNASRSGVSKNRVTVGDAGHKEGVAYEIAGTYSTATGNIAHATQTTNPVAYRANTVACGAWPSCGQGAAVAFSGNTYDMAAGVGVELFGFGSTWTGGAGIMGAGGQHFAFAEQQQRTVAGGTYQGGAVGAGASVKRICAGGTNDGRMCTVAGDCPSGSCEDPGGVINWTVADATFFGVTGVGVYCVTGCHYQGGRATWFGATDACGVMLGDDRGPILAATSHSVIEGITFHSANAGFKGVCFPDVSGLTVSQTTLGDLLCLTGTCIDFATSFDASSPDVTDLAIDGVTCASNVGTCLAFPTTAQGKVTKVRVGDVASAATTSISGWIPSMGTRPVSATFAGSSPLGTGATCYLGNGHVTTSCPAAGGVGEWTVPADGQLGLMRCSVDTAPGSTNSRTFDLQIGGVDASGHTCTITGSATTCLDEDTSTAVTAGQRVRIEQTRSGAAAATGSCVVEFHRS